MRVSKKVLVIICVIVLLSFIISGCDLFCSLCCNNDDNEGENERTGGEFIINNGYELITLDPHRIEWGGIAEQNLNMALFEGLTIYDPETALASPGVAETWDVSDDGMTYTFHLREAYWTDGVRVTAQQFVDSWLRELNPETGSPSSWLPCMFIEGASEYAAGIAGPEAVQIRALDDSTFQMDLIEPKPNVIDALSHYAFTLVPIHTIELYGDEWTLPENLVCNGPFMLEEWKPYEYISVVHNPDYWDAEAVNLDRVKYLPINDINVAHTMYLYGDLDWSDGIPLDQVDIVKLRDDYQNASIIGTYFYLFETTTAPTNDVRVRKALSMAINRQDLVGHYITGNRFPAYGLVPEMYGYPSRELVTEDIEEAQSLLADAGYPNGAGWPENVQILYNTSTGHQAIAEFVVQEWKENLGIDVALVNMEWVDYVQAARAHDFTITRSGWIGDYPDPNTFLDLFITDGSLNYGQYSNAAFDAAIYQANRMELGTARYDVLREAEDKIITEDMAIMPLYFYNADNMIDLDVWGGWYSNVMDCHPVKDIYLK